MQGIKVNRKDLDRPSVAATPALLGHFPDLESLYFRESGRPEATDDYIHAIYAGVCYGRARDCYAPCQHIQETPSASSCVSFTGGVTPPAVLVTFQDGDHYFDSALRPSLSDDDTP